MPNNVVDLDILRPPTRMVKLNDREIDVSFVPCGITFDVDEIREELVEVVIAIEEETGLKGEEALLEVPNSPNSKQAFGLGVKMCAIFCSVDHPDMDVDWFMKNSSPAQVGIMSQEIQNALLSSIKGVEDYQKKTEATKGK